MTGNLTSPSGSIIRHLTGLLGDDVVLLPCGKGEKGSRWEKWQELTIGKMREQPYLSALGRAHNIAVLLGKASGGLCTIDIDGDESIEPFLKLNPKLTTTLRSRGKRGCNLWVRIKGDFPGTSPIKRQDGNAWGEWRSDRNCTMIHGIHPEGMCYERSPEVPPIEMAFEEIVWPSDLVQPWKQDRAKNETKSSCDSARKLTADEVRDMLYCIPARPDYEQWLRVSSAVWSALGEDEGTALLRAWSPEENPGEYDDKFKHRLERVTAGTLVHIAKEHGWRGKTPVRSDIAPAMTPEEAIEKFYYDGNGKYHLDTGVLLVPMDQRSVIRHLKLWGFADTPASDGVPGVEVINPMLCEMQTRRYVRKADEINRFGPDDLLARAYELAFDENTTPPPDELCMNLGGTRSPHGATSPASKGNPRSASPPSSPPSLVPANGGNTHALATRSASNGKAMIKARLSTWIPSRVAATGTRWCVVPSGVRACHPFRTDCFPSHWSALPAASASPFLNWCWTGKRKSTAVSTRWCSTAWPTCAPHPTTRPSHWSSFPDCTHWLRNTRRPSSACYTKTRSAKARLAGTSAAS